MARPRPRASLSSQDPSYSTQGIRSRGNIKKSEDSSAIWVGRILFLLALLVVAIVLGFVAYYGLRNSEIGLADSQFWSLANRATVSAVRIVERKRLGALSMASVVEFSHPDPAAWPFVAVHGFEDISKKVIGSSDGRQYGFAPIVMPDEREAWEEFAYDWMHVSRVPEPLSNTSGVSSFGKGMWETDPSNPDDRTRSESVQTTYASPYEIFTPLFQITKTEAVLMRNLHAEERRGVSIDHVIRCAENRAISRNASAECLQLSDPVVLVNVDSPGALIMSPIYPAGDPFNLKGILASSIAWKEILEGLFESSVSGVDCVLRTSNSAVTYRITNGEPISMGTGDLHNRLYDDYASSISLTKDLFSDSSGKYSLTLYPTSTFFDVYSTSNPTIAAIGAVCIIVITSLLFILYDSSVRKEFSANHDLLQAKREFMRFVSHEVRTPLNSVSIGAKLLTDEMCSFSREKVHNYDLTNSTIKTIEDRDDRYVNEAMSQEKMADWMGLVEGIITNTDCAVNVLNELLQWDKIEAGKLTLELSEIRIENLIRKTTSEFEIVAQKKNVRLPVVCEVASDILSEQDLEKGDPTRFVVIGDSIRLIQCLRNLLSNALKFSSDSGEVAVRSRYTRGDSRLAVDQSQTFKMQNNAEVSYESAGCIHITVKDQGVGMEQHELDNLFRDGVQFSRNIHQGGQGMLWSKVIEHIAHTTMALSLLTTDKSGSGLGLYVAKGLIEQHGGTLCAASEGRNKGTSFTITIPVFLSSQNAASATDVHMDDMDDSEANPAAVSTTQSNELVMRILVVDDAAMNRKLLSRLLTKAGHICDMAANGNEAVQMVEQSEHRFDTIIMDKEMPECDGPTAVRRLRANQCDSFIVGLTGSVLPEDLEEFKESGVNDVLAKPFRPNELESLWIENCILGSVPRQSSVGD